VSFLFDVFIKRYADNGKVAPFADDTHAIMFEESRREHADGPQLQRWIGDQVVQININEERQTTR